MSKSKDQAENLQSQRVTTGERDLSQMSPTDIVALMHELDTHRIELEMQNEELRKIQNELIETRDQYTELYNDAPSGYVSLDKEGFITQANLTFAGMLGVPRENLSGQPLSAYIVDEDQDRYFLHKKATLESGERKSCELRLKRDIKEALWVDLSCVAIGNEDGERDEVRCIASDMAAHKQVEAERERLITAIDYAAEAIVITDMKGAIQYVNPAFEQISGYSRSEVLGQNPKILKSGYHNAFFYQELWNKLTEGYVWKGQFVNRRKDGLLYTEEATLSSVLDSDGEPMNYVAIKRDITAELQKETELRQAQKMEAVGHLVGGIAHDFNNILQAINGFAELALVKVDPQASVHEDITEIVDAGHRAASLVQQLLAIGRKQTSRPSDLDLNEVTNRILKMICRALPEHIELEFIPVSELKAVYVDRGQIEQILMNLCLNASEAMPDGGKLTIETKNLLISKEEAEIRPWARPGHYVLLCVTDTGCGMSPSTKNQLFDPFFTTKEVGQGSGLGLSMVYGILEQNGGHIEVSSEPGKGTVFTVYFPAVECEAAPPPDVNVVSVPGGTETVLIAEDNEAVLQLTKVALSSAGYTVFTAQDGQEAVQIFEEHVDEIDLVIFDVIMPRLGGKKAMEKVLKLRPKLPHLFASGYVGNGIHAGIGFIDEENPPLLTKPYRAVELLHKVRDLLDRKTH